jgi:hypothetical protein
MVHCMSTTSTLLEKANAQASLTPFDPDSYLTAMSCGLIDGCSLGLPFAQPAPFWQKNRAYLAGFRAGNTESPRVNAPFADREKWAQQYCEPTSHAIDIRYVDGAELTIYVPTDFKIETLVADPTIESFQTL